MGQRPVGTSAHALTAGEVRVLRLRLAGLGTTAIAGELGISVSTVATATSRTKDKLGLTERRDWLDVARRALALAGGHASAPQAAAAVSQASSTP
jgi:DNA-binding CsgD family transcriptional regulator